MLKVDTVLHSLSLLNVNLIEALLKSDMANSYIG